MNDSERIASLESDVSHLKNEIEAMRSAIRKLTTADIVSLQAAGRALARGEDLDETVQKLVALHREVQALINVEDYE